jgi:hypothetical protein
MTWTKSSIREARKVALAPLLASRGYHLLPLANGNYRVQPNAAHPAGLDGLVIKENFWNWPDRHIAGNPIDFFTRVENISFHAAMQIITAHAAYDAAERPLQ